MTRALMATAGVAALGTILVAQAPAPTRPRLAVSHKAVQPPATQAAAAAPASDVVQKYCVGCHSAQGKAGGLSLVGFDATHAEQQAETAERMIRKLRAGMMPPPGARRPDADALAALATSLETRIDAAAALHPNPGRRTFQ